MCAKEYMERVRNVDKRIQSKLTEAKRLQAVRKGIEDLQMWAGVAEPAAGGSSVQKLRELEGEVQTEVDQLVETRKRVWHTIRQLEDEQQRVLLELRYLCAKKWEDIAREMHYSWAQVHRIHARSLDAVERVIHNDIFA